MSRDFRLAGHSSWTLGESHATSIGWYFVARLAAAFFGDPDA